MSSAISNDERLMAYSVTNSMALNDNRLVALMAGSPKGDVLPDRLRRNLLRIQPAIIFER